jgi:acetoin utilization deacetylase AcuC-like enzyme
MKIFYSEKCLEYRASGHPESPERVKLTHAFLKKNGYTFQEPSPCTEEDILLVHTGDLLGRVKNGNFMDFDTPALPNINDYALLSVGSAMEAMQSALDGEAAFSLMRPPGHHATKSTLGGFCYFNNIAVATKRALASVKKAAVIDIDCHHGNGTEDIFLSEKNLLYISLHQSPLYPGTGLASKQNCINFPLAPFTNADTYLSVFEKALKEVEDFDPDIIGVSAGFDTYKNDPITNLSLDFEDYKKIGAMLRGCNKPLFTVLEGGYDMDIPHCILSYLQGVEP